MSSEDIKEACFLMINIVKTFGMMTLEEIKSFYQTEMGVKKFPFDSNLDKEIHAALLFSEKHIKYDPDTKRYFDEKALTSINSKSPMRRCRSSSSINKDSKENDFPPHRQSRLRSRNKNEIKQRRKSARSRSKSEVRIMRADLLQYQKCVLIGDDFLLYFAMPELMKKSPYERKIYRNGLCTSGLTIKEATDKLRALKSPKFEKALVYLGSFDILNGNQLIQLINDFDDFVEVCQGKEIKAIACTLAPLPFHEHENRNNILNGFNKYLKTKSKLSVIDVNMRFLNPNDEPNDHCYGEYLKRVDGSNHLVKLWNDFGHEQFERVVMANLGSALIDDDNLVHDF